MKHGRECLGETEEIARSREYDFESAIPCMSGTFHVLKFIVDYSYSEVWI